MIYEFEGKNEKDAIEIGTITFSIVEDCIVWLLDSEWRSDIQ